MGLTAKRVRSIVHPCLGPGTADFTLHNVLYAPALLPYIAIPIGVEVVFTQVTHDDVRVGAWDHPDGHLEEIPTT